MILLDPDLDPDAAPHPAASRRPASDLRVPSTAALARFLTQARRAAKLRGQVSVLLTTDAEQRKLNRRFRGKDKSTDVLSFPADSTAPGAGKIGGDLSISIPTARRQAVQQGHSLATEVKVLILHGVLHLAGHDHESDSGQMDRLERALRARLRLPGGLIERTTAASNPKKSKPPAKRPRA